MPIDLTNAKRIYREQIDNLIDQLGKPVVLHFEEKVDSIQNDARDFIRITGKVPDFKSNKPQITETTKTITALIKWNPRELMDFGINVQQGKHMVRLKTFLTDVPDLMRAKYVVPNAQSLGIIDKKFQIWKPPVPIGLGQDRYAITFWKEA